MPRTKSTKATTSSPYPIRNKPQARMNTSDNEISPDPNPYAAIEENEIDLDNLDNNCPLTVGHLREFMNRMEANYNSRLDKKVESIREDISQIKVQMDRSGEQFEEFHTRLSTVEDQTGKIDEIEIDLQSFRELWEESLTEINKDACRARKNNIIFHGIKGGSKDQDVAMANLKRVCKEHLKMSQDWINEMDIDEVYHFPSKGGEGPWPLFVKFGKSRQRDDLFRSAYNLKDSGITMRNDLAPCLLRIRKLLIEEADKLQLAPFNYRTRLRDTPFEVILWVLKPNAKKWSKWPEEPE